MQIDATKLARAFEENPTAFMAAAGGLLMGVSKIITAVGDSRGSHAYARDVKRRVQRDKMKMK